MAVVGAARTVSRDGAPQAAFVVPIKNAMQFLPRTAPSLLAAARHHGAAQVIYVDNGSTDGSAEYVESLNAPEVRLLRCPTATIAALRNAGARSSAAAHVAFLDADCTVGDSYLTDALAVLAETGAAATGCEVELPDHPHWLERTLHDLHFMGRERDVVYINSANFVVTRHAFDAVHGFREELRTGEDADIGQRLVVAGYRLHESPRVRAVHLGNPHSIGAYYRRVVWHGLGMFATVTRHRLDRPTVMLVVHLLATVIGIVTLVAAPWKVGARVAVALLLQLAVPATTVTFRMMQTRRIPNVPQALLLYWFYYVARAHAAMLLLTGGAARYRK